MYVEKPCFDCVRVCEVYVDSFLIDVHESMLTITLFLQAVVSHHVILKSSILFEFNKY